MIRYIVVVLVGILIVGLGVGLFGNDEPSLALDGTGHHDTTVPSVVGDEGGVISTLAVAQRKGRCRAMKFHLNEMLQVKSDSDVEAKRRALGLLAGELMNGYSTNTAMDPSSNALPIINTTGGRQDLNEAREAFRETLRSVKGKTGKEAAVLISESCIACHSRFMRQKGQHFSLLDGN